MNFDTFVPIPGYYKFDEGMGIVLLGIDLILDLVPIDLIDIYFPGGAYNGG